MILYQFLTGERPFAGSATTTMQKVLKEDPLPPSTLNVQLPDAIDAVVRKALAKKPEERYQTAAEFAAELRAAVGHRTIGRDAAARRPRPPRRPPRCTSPRAADATIVRPAPRPCGTGPRPRASADRPARPPPRRAEVAGDRDRASWRACWLRPWPPACGCGCSVPTGPAVDGATARLRRRAGTAGGGPRQRLRHRARPRLADRCRLRAASGGRRRAGRGTRGPVAPQRPPSKSAAGHDGDHCGGARRSVAIRATRAMPRCCSRICAPTPMASSCEKALGLLVEPRVAREELRRPERAPSRRRATASSARSMRESAPRVGKDGLVSMTTEAVVERQGRAEVAQPDDAQRAHPADPRRRRSAHRAADRRARCRPRRTRRRARRPIAENLLKDRVKVFGFRTWTQTSEPGQGRRFPRQRRCEGRATDDAPRSVRHHGHQVRGHGAHASNASTGRRARRSTSTRCCPKGTGSWATEEEALRAIGGKIADEFSRDFFLAHVYATGRRVALVVEGLPDGAADLFGREFAGLPAVIAARPRRREGPRRVWDLELRRRSGTACGSRGVRRPCAAQPQAGADLPRAGRQARATRCARRSTHAAPMRR